MSAVLNENSIDTPALPTDYAALVAEFNKLPAPIAAFGRQIQAGFDMEDFLKTKVGELIVGRALEQAQVAIAAILDPNLKDEATMLCVRELRVQHRLLETISLTLKEGKKAQHSIMEYEASQGLTNPDQPEGDDDAGSNDEL